MMYSQMNEEFLDDRSENVAAAKQAGMNAAVYLGAEGAFTFRRVLAEYGLSASHSSA